MTKTIEEILAPKPEARPRIYAYTIDDKAHNGLLKVGQTTRDVKQRIAEQVKTAAIKNYKIELDESAERNDGTIFSDHHVRAALVKKGFENSTLEWMRCTVADVKTVLTELRTGLILDRHRPDSEGLPPACAPEGIQYRTDELGCLCLPPLRRCLTLLHRNREPRWSDALRLTFGLALNVSWPRRPGSQRTSSSHNTDWNSHPKKSDNISVKE
jgi:hypothetical protein